MADEVMEYTFEEELYKSISLLSFWEEGKAQMTPGGVLFEMNNISAVADFRAIGRISLDVRENKERPIEFLTVDLLLAKGAKEDNVQAITNKLYDVNLGLKEGMFYMDEEGNLSYEVNFPVVRGNVEISLQLFIAEYMDLSNYIDGVYPYLLRLMARPEDADFTQYIVAMLADDGSEA